MTFQVVTFEDILAGAAGAAEAAHARRWLDAGAPLAPPPPDLVRALEGGGPVDVRVLRDPTREWRPAAAGSESPPPRQQQQQQQQQPKRRPPGDGAPPAAKRRRSGGDADIYGRGAFVGHGDAIGTMARRRARTLAEPPPAAAPPPARKGRPPPPPPPPQQQQRDAEDIPCNWTTYIVRDPGGGERRSYVSPEGLVCDGAAAARAVLAARARPLPVSLPAALAWVRGLAAGGAAGAGAAPLPNVLALQRMRVVTHAEEGAGARRRRGGPRSTPPGRRELPPERPPTRVLDRRKSS